MQYFSVASDAQSCSSKKEAECKCNERIETGSDVRMLIQKTTELAQTCLRQNTIKYQACYNKTTAMMNCHTKVIAILDNDPIFKQAKQDAMQEVDRCFQANPPSAFDAMCMLLKKGPGGPGEKGGKGPGGPDGNEMRRGPPPPPMGGDDMEGPMGGPPMAEPFGMGMGPDPSECLKLIVKSLFGQPERRGPPPMDFNGPPQMRFGGMDERPGPGPRGSCKEFEMCMMDAKKKSGSDQMLLSAARRIFDQKNKCTADNLPSFDCIPVSPERHECMKSAMESMMFYKMQKMKTCMKEAGAPMMGGWW